MTSTLPVSDSRIARRIDADALVDAAGLTDEYRRGEQS